MIVNTPLGIKYTIVKRLNGMFQPQKEYGNKMLYPAFDTLRDANIYMKHIEQNYDCSITGNVQIIKEGYKNV